MGFFFLGVPGHRWKVRRPGRFGLVGLSPWGAGWLVPLLVVAGAWRGLGLLGCAPRCCLLLVRLRVTCGLLRVAAVTGLCGRCAAAVPGSVGAGHSCDGVPK